MAEIEELLKRIYELEEQNRLLQDTVDKHEKLIEKEPPKKAISE